VRFGAVPGLAFDVADPDGALWALVVLLDGSRTFEQLILDLPPAFLVEDVLLALGDLYGTGHLEDAAEPEPAELTEAERERYSRGRELYRWRDREPRTSSWAAQLALKRARVLVVGLGGVGGFVALALALSGVGRLHCLDRDVVSRSDFNRHVLFTEQDLYEPKAHAAVRHLRARNSTVHITGARRDVDGPETLAAIVAGFDVVVLAADSPPEIVSWTNRVCHDAETRWVWCGYDGPLMTVGVYQPRTGPCYDCARTAKEEFLAGEPPRTEWPPAAGIDPPHAASIVTVAMAGSLAADAVIGLLAGVPAVQVNRLHQLNLDRREFTLAGPDTPHPDCPTCGPSS
jgi:molybdopterin/thiamine biosynthesis adenylyltransferase